MFYRFGMDDVAQTISGPEVQVRTAAYLPADEADDQRPKRLGLSGFARRGHWDAHHALRAAIAVVAPAHVFSRAQHGGPGAQRGTK